MPVTDRKLHWVYGRTTDHLTSNGKELIIIAGDWRLIPGTHSLHNHLFSEHPPGTWLKVMLEVVDETEVKSEPGTEAWLHKVTVGRTKIIRRVTAVGIPTREELMEALALEVSTCTSVTDDEHEALVNFIKLVVTGA